MTIEEMDAEIAVMDAHLKRIYDDAVAEATEELATEKNPYFREFLIKHIEAMHKIHNRRYD
jgi:hypothetical protein